MTDRNAYETVDRQRRTTKTRQRTNVAQAGSGGEFSIIVSAKDPYANCDVYVTPSPGEANLASFVGSIWRMYAILDGQRSEEFRETLAAAPTAGQTLRVLGGRARGGCDEFEITCRFDSALPLPTLPLDVMCVTWDGATGGSSPSPSPTGGVRSYVDLAAMATNGVISASGSRRLWKIYGTIDPGAAAPRYIHIFNKPSAPALGDVPISPRVYVGAGASFSLTFEGRQFATGISWGVSTTRDTFTQSADVADVGAELE